MPLGPFTGESPDDPHAGQVFLADIGNPAFLLVAAFKALVHLFAEEDGVGQDKGNRAGGDEGHLHAHGEHEVEAHDEEDQDPEDRRQLTLEDFLEESSIQEETARKEMLDALNARYQLDFAGHLEQIYRGEILHKTVEYMRKHYPGTGREN